MNFFRLQRAGINFDAMVKFVSADGGDDCDTGLCVTESVSDTRFGGADGAYNADAGEGEVVVMKGRVISRIYDGYRIEPTKEIARFTFAEWLAMVEDGSAEQYEDWN